MFFLKPKSRTDELLPPPPPFPTLELEETKKSDFFDETLDIVKSKELLTEDEEYTGLVNELDNELKPKRTSKKPEIAIKKELAVKEKPFVDAKLEKSKEKKQPIKVGTLRKTQIKKEKIPKLEDDFDFNFPKELEDVNAMGTLKEFGIEDNQNDFNKDIDINISPEHELFQATKPKEILEAEEEIKSAIEKIKAKEKPSIFKRLFSKPPKAKDAAELQKPFEIEKTTPEIPVLDNVSAIQSNINKARESLMKFDLEAAKVYYVKIMKVYNTLQPQDQAKFYHDIRELYFERKSAEELKA